MSPEPLYICRTCKRYTMTSGDISCPVCSGTTWEVVNEPLISQTKQTSSDPLSLVDLLHIMDAYKHLEMPNIRHWTLMTSDAVPFEKVCVLSKMIEPGYIVAMSSVARRQLEPLSDFDILTAMAKHVREKK